MLLQRQPVGERLGNRLQGEMLAGIANLIDKSVMRGDANAESIGINIRKLWDVVGNDTFDKRLKPCTKRLEVVLDGRRGHGVLSKWKLRGLCNIGAGRAPRQSVRRKTATTRSPYSCVRMMAHARKLT